MARKRGKRRKATKEDAARQSFETGWSIIKRHPLFTPLVTHASIRRWNPSPCPEDGWALVTSSGNVYAHPTRLGQPDQWVYVLAHCLLHLGFGHFREREHQREWNLACDCVVARFTADLKLGRCHDPFPPGVEIPRGTEERLYDSFCSRGIPDELQGMGTAGRHRNDMAMVSEPTNSWHTPTDWQGCFAAGLAMAASSAVNVAAGVDESLGSASTAVTPARRAKEWFVSSYPLLGALAASFEIVEDREVCMRMSISVAAVDGEAKEVFVNPGAGLEVYECRFVMAHELLHVGLRHDTRCQGRDPFLWNVACDYVINGWLIEMGLGELPKIGVLHDADLQGLSAEAVYDRIVTDVRRYRKLATLCGKGLPDILQRGQANWWRVGKGIELDDFYRGCLSQGLRYHDEQGRGFLPAGLVEEIRSLAQPPIPWDVELAEWFDDHFSPLEKVRSYARPSRRQSSTPDIPRPRWVPAAGAEDGRTFGVLLDTSGSMDRALLAKALGAIASYSLSRDVPAARVVFCDAATYDQGYLPPEAIADRVKVRGRGGTVLQPGVDLLEKAEDFPKDGPLLIITDGYCDRLRIRREHAFLIPRGHHLPFVAKGKVFRIA